MSFSSTQYCFNVLDRITLHGRDFRHHSSSKEGIMVESNDDGPPVVLALTWKEVEEHLSDFRMSAQRDYYKLVKDGVMSSFSSDQVACFRRYASLVFSVMRPTVRQVYHQMEHDLLWSMGNGQPTLELCSERTFHRLVDEMRRSAPMAMCAPLTGAQSN